MVTLTSEQIAAITSNASKILVKAGAGTGKTEVLTRRILYLLEQDEELTVRDFAVITFTNKATENVKDRIKNHLFNKYMTAQSQKEKDRYRNELDALNLAQISTIHQFCRLILNYAGPFQTESSNSYAPSYAVSERALREAVEQVVSNWINSDVNQKEVLLETLPPHDLKKYLMSAYLLIRNKGLPLEDVLSETKKTMLLQDVGNIATIKGFFIDLLNALKQEETIRKLNTLNTDDLLAYAVDVLRNNPAVVERLQGRFRHVFVDEFQDTSVYQAEILRYICDTGNRPAHLFVVGDVKQSIYQFRGADVTSYKSMEDWIRQQGIVLSLRTNFRSVKPIVDFVNETFRCIANDEKKPDFEVEDLQAFDTSQDDNENVIKYIKFKNNPVDTVVKTILEEIEQGAHYGQFAVLFRTNRNMDEYEHALRTAGIPVQKTGAGKLFARREIKELYRILNWMVTPKDPIKREEALSVDWIAGSEEYLSRLEYEIIPHAAKYTVTQVIEAVMRLAHVRDYYLIKDDRQSIANLDRLKEITRQYWKDESIQLVDYVNWLSVQMATNHDEPQAEISDDVLDAVQLITIHKAKGLEYPYVILPENDRNLVSPGLIPSILYSAGSGLEFQIKPRVWYKTKISSSHYDQAKELYLKEYLAEEARVLYVALTRAEKKLFLLINEDTSNKIVCYQNWIKQQDNEANELKVDPIIMEESYQYRSTEDEDEQPIVQTVDFEEEQNRKSQSKLWRHQEEAVDTFLASGSGIIEMATGTGKTRTSIEIIKRLLDTKQIDSVVVTVSGNDLLDQWYEELLVLDDLRFLRQYGQYKQASTFQLLSKKSALIISHQELIKVIKNFRRNIFERSILVCDEVHGIGAESKVLNLSGELRKFKYRLGLSATPEREYDEVGNQFIQEEIGPVIYRYPLEAAIREGILCEFDYVPLEYELTPEDRKAIRSVIAAFHAESKDLQEKNKTELYTRLAQIRKTSKGKLPIFEDFIHKNPHLLKRCIIYVETKEFGEWIQNIILNINPNYHTYFGDDHSEDLQRFSRGELDCLIAAKRISEGIDIRSIEKVILMTADRSLTQTIQRIGRCLRIDPNNPNKRATVIDLVEKQEGDSTEEEREVIKADQQRKNWLIKLSQIRREV